MTSNAAAAGRSGPCTDAGIDMLAKALRSTKNTACLSAASRLLALTNSATYYDLHLRRADLRAVDAMTIAKALATASDDDCVALRSFSLSYNTGLTDVSVVGLVDSFPPSVTEIGLVGCDLGDDAGAALVQWARQAPYLQMICVEQNGFSKEIHAAFGSLADDKPDLIVTV